MLAIRGYSTMPAKKKKTPQPSVSNKILGKAFRFVAWKSSQATSFLLYGMIMAMINIYLNGLYIPKP